MISCVIIKSLSLPAKMLKVQEKLRLLLRLWRRKRVRCPKCNSKKMNTNNSWLIDSPTMRLNTRLKIKRQQTMMRNSNCSYRQRMRCVLKVTKRSRKCKRSVCQWPSLLFCVLFKLLTEKTTSFITLWLQSLRLMMWSKPAAKLVSQPKLSAIIARLGKRTSARSLSWRNRLRTNAPTWTR